MIDSGISDEATVEMDGLRGQKGVGEEAAYADAPGVVEA